MNKINRRCFVKGLGVAVMGLGFSGSLTGALSACTNTGNGAGSSLDENSSVNGNGAAGAKIDFSNWDAVVKAAMGTTVIHAGYSGDNSLNEWIVGPLTKTMKDKYDITVKYAKDLDTTTLLADENAAGVAEDGGTFDTAWVNGMTFRAPQLQDQWFGPITDKLPNFNTYIDKSDPLVTKDFTISNHGYEAPFSRAQIVFINDSARTPEMPRNPDEFLSFCKKYPGTVTYPVANFWLGAAFIRTIIYNMLGWEQFQTIEAHYDVIKKEIDPVLEYLRELNPYLWKQGTTFPADHAALEAMFLSGEGNFVVTYGQNDCGIGIKKGFYPKTAQSYIFDGGTCANMSYWAVAYNAPNKPGALVLINEMLSPELQLEKAIVGEGYVTDLTKVSPALKTQFESIDLGPNNVSSASLLAHALPEFSADIEAIVANIWKREVLGKTN
ncbi:MAG: ABC transporter substrate-binding protein [Coriobacteriales bacterium]|nr:ABC transporter substrate-binding protein [Coriobacteriales bacterium]